MPHLRNIKELEQPRGQPTEQTKTQQTTKKGRTDGADERRSALTPTMKAAPFPAPRTGPVTTCGGKTVAQSDCGRRRHAGSETWGAFDTPLSTASGHWRQSCTQVSHTCAQSAESVPVCVTYQPIRRKRFRWVMGVKGTLLTHQGRHRPTPQNGRHGAPPPAGGMPTPRLKPHRVPYDVRGGRRAMPLEAWQPVGCVRVRWHPHPIGRLAG